MLRRAFLSSAVSLLVIVASAQSQDAPRTPPARALAALFPGAGRIVYMVAPSDTDPGIRNFVQNNVVVFDRGPAPQNLLVFMSGTSGAPLGGRYFLNAAADAGYRVIGLEYDDIPAAVQVCQRDRDRSCFARFREKRIYGTNVMDEIPDLPAESIINRLRKLLEYLDKQHPGEGWSDYLLDGKPNWARIAVSGHSQGAGMAAFIAKRELVARVILFSCPWDYFGPTRELAPWISARSVTPADRWYGAYHQRELEADTLKRAYAALHIPPDHIRVMTLEPGRQLAKPSPNPYHISMIGITTPLDGDGRPAYSKDWAFMLGKGQ